MLKTQKNYLKDPELYEIYEKLRKSKFKIDPDEFFKDLLLMTIIAGFQSDNPFEAYLEIVKVLETKIKDINLRFFYMNSFYQYLNHENLKNWKEKKFISYVKNYEKGYRQKQSKKNSLEILEYTKKVLEGIPETIENFKELRRYKIQQKQLFLNSKQKDLNSDNNNKNEKKINKGNETTNSDTETEKNNDDKSPKNENKSAKKIIFNLKPYKLTQMQTALFIYYLENSKHIKYIHVFAASEKVRKLQAAEKRLKQFNLNKSADSFMHKYNQISNYKDKRICLSQVKNIKRIIKLLDDFPEAKKLAEEELKSAEISKY